MERSCYKCGTVMEDSVPFCPNCGAPQIRVVPPSETSAAWEPGETAARLSASASSAEPGSTTAPQAGTGPQPLATSHASTDPSEVPVQFKSGVEWSHALSASVAAGAIIALSWAVPVFGLFLWMAATGILAVLLYGRRTPQAKPTAGAGARIGLVAGLFGFGIFASLLALRIVLFRDGGRLRGLLQQMLQQAAAQNADPRAQEIVQRLMSPEGLAVVLAVILAVSFVAFLLFSSLGGALGAYLLRNRRER